MAHGKALWAREERLIVRQERRLCAREGVILVVRGHDRAGLAAIHTTRSSSALAETDGAREAGLLLTRAARLYARDQYAESEDLARRALDLAKRAGAEEGA